MGSCGGQVVERERISASGILFFVHKVDGFSVEIQQSYSPVNYQLEALLTLPPPPSPLKKLFSICLTSKIICYIWGKFMN